MNAWTLLLAIGLVGMQQNAAVDPTQPAPARAEIPRIECGLDASEFVLRAYGYSYDARQLRRQLIDSKERISVGAIIKALQSHCVNVEARRDIRLGGLRSYLTQDPNHLVILCTTAEGGGLGHAVVMAGRARDAAIFDYAKGFTTVSWKEAGETLDRPTLDSVALLVSPSGPFRAQPRNDILCAPDINLGVMPSGEAILQEATLRNAGSLALTVVRSKTPCGCIKVEVPDPLIPAGGSIPVSIQVNPDRWGSAKEKTIQFTFADGSYTHLALKGRTESSSGLMALPSRLTESFAEGSSPPEVERTVRIMGLNEAELGGTLGLSANVPWLRLEPSAAADPAMEADSRHVRVNIAFPADALVAGKKTEGKIVATAEASGRSVQVPVELECKPLFRVQPAFLLRPNLAEPVSLRVTRQEGEEPFRIVSAEGPAIRAEHSPDWATESLELTVQTADAPTAPSGTESLQIILEDRETAAKFTVTVPLLNLASP